MNILMMTNTYKPIVGGLEKSIEIFAKELRKKGHKVIIVAPEYKGVSKKEKNVVRVPAIQHFNGTDFSVQLPIPLVLTHHLKGFVPDIVHSHHPFLIGDTALRVSAEYNIPIVFTFHTLYEKYVHYVPVEATSMKKFVIELSKGYANLCNYVFAPSESIANILKKRGVKTSIEVNPTGIYTQEFLKSNDQRIRKELNIPEDAYVVGCIGRIASEKNIVFLTKAVSEFIKEKDNAFFLLIGNGPLVENVQTVFKKKKIENRLRLPGILKGKKLRDAYKVMNVFAFASLSETQGIVLIEAMASGVPVVAIDASGVREVVKNEWNGFLLEEQDEKQFTLTLNKIYDLKEDKKRTLTKNALETAKQYSVENSINKVIETYEKVIHQGYKKSDIEKNTWQNATDMLKTEWHIASNIAKAAKKAVNLK